MSIHLCKKRGKGHTIPAASPLSTSKCAGEPTRDVLARAALPLGESVRPEDFRFHFRPCYTSAAFVNEAGPVVRSFASFSSFGFVCVSFFGALPPCVCGSDRSGSKRVPTAFRAREETTSDGALSAFSKRKCFATHQTRADGAPLYIDDVD